MRARKYLLALGIFALALVLMLIVSSRASAEKIDSACDNELVGTDIDIESDKLPERGNDLQIISDNKPDLAITDATPSQAKPQENELVTLTVRVENLGSAPAKNIVTSFYVEEEQVASEEIEFLSSSRKCVNLPERKTLTRSTGTLEFSWRAEEGVHSLVFYVDPNNEIREVNEANNYYKLTLAVEPAVYQEQNSITPAQPGTSTITVAATVSMLSILTLLALAIDRYKFYGLLAPLYVKLKREKLLDQFTRGRIYGYLEAHPGAHYSLIKSALMLNNSTLAYHLKTLEREDYIKSRKEGKLRCFYPANFALKNKNGLSKLQNEILKNVSIEPGLTQKALIERLGNVSQQVVNYNVKALNKLGALRVERNGKETYLFSSAYAAN